MLPLVTIDGAAGEGGGQVLRSSLALSLGTGIPFRIENIRAGRKNPGLLRQHVVSVEAARRVGSAEVTGGALGSRTLTFKPQGCQGGVHHLKVGSAGSTALVAQAVVPALLFADGPSELVIEGGTHAKFAPPFEFLRDTWLPQLARLGAQVEATLEVPGFFPVGGGRIRIRITPTAQPKRLELTERGERLSVEARALVANLPADIATRELDTVAKRLGWRPSDLLVDPCPNARSTGNALVLKVEHAHVTEVFVGFGAQGVRAEDVARRACRDARRWMSGTAPVGPFLADQLMLPLVLGAGGRYRTGPLSRHAQTNLDVIRQFTDLPLAVHPVDPDAAPGGAVEVRIGA